MKLYHVFCKADGSWLSIEGNPAGGNHVYKKDRTDAAILTEVEAEKLGYPQPPCYILREVPTIWDEDGMKGPVQLTMP